MEKIMPDWINTLINGIIALGTLVTSIFTWRAATRAADSAELTQSQFKMNEEQFLRERSPKILPISQTYSKGSTDIDVCLNKEDRIGKNNSDIKIRLVNVGLGNAYYVEIKLSISNIEEIWNAVLKQPLNKLSYKGCPYEITFDNHIPKKQLRVDFLRNRLGPSNRIYSLNENIIHKTLFHSNDEIIFNLSDFQHILFIHKLYLQFSDESDRKLEPKFEIFIKYKNEFQLGSSQNTHEKYEIKFRDLRTILTPSVNIFRVDFKRI